MHDLLSTGPRWYVISLRPRGQHAGLRSAVRRAGHCFIAMSPIRTVAHCDAKTRTALDAALAADVTVFTSPTAVRAAAALRPLATLERAAAVGAGTARALRRAGVRAVEYPTRMDSEGLLGLQVLTDVRGRRVGLVTAPGGRGLLPAALSARGADVVRADVYAREPCVLADARRRMLRESPGPLALALTSGEALDALLAQLDATEIDRLRASRVVAASARLAAAAGERGFADVVRAAGPRPAQLVAGLNRHAC